MTPERKQILGERVFEEEWWTNSSRGRSQNAERGDGNELMDRHLGLRK